MASLDPLSTTVSALERDELIPDVLPASFTPTLLFSVVWPSGKEALLGNELQKEDVAEEPALSFMHMNVPAEDADSDGAGAGEATYTLALFDPDAPSRTDAKYKSFRHWVITGLKAPASTAAETANQTAVQSKPSTTPYRPPAPGPGTGLHRYVFLLFQEPRGGIAIPEGAPEYGAALEERRSWNALSFGEKYGLKLLGANFFLCKVAL